MMTKSNSVPFSPQDGPLLDGIHTVISSLSSVGFLDEQAEEDWVDGGVLRVDRKLRDLVKKSGLCQVRES
jgi:hypothetical protein